MKKTNVKYYKKSKKPVMLRRAGQFLVKTSVVTIFTESVKAIFHHLV